MLRAEAIPHTSDMQKLFKDIKLSVVYLHCKFSFTKFAA